MKVKERVKERVRERERECARERERDKKRARARKGKNESRPLKMNHDIHKRYHTHSSHFVW